MSDPRITEWFKAVDTDNSGRINASELVKALHSAGLDISVAFAGTLIRMFDDQRQGRLGLVQFENMHKWIMSVRQHFLRFDADASRSLSYHEISQALQSAGFNVDPTPFSELCKTFDPDCTGTLSMSGYLGLCVLLQQASKVFGEYDSQRMGRIGLDFNQFLYCAALVR
ncbi:unnamed protein product [Pedinophyceae sp. YPF-701]|nr:unnamed protein product [Pedinophyceae sp. YPF-701]